MARTYAPVLVSIWNDPHFTALSEGAQRLYVVANSQSSMTYCGVVPFMPVSWSGLATNSTASKIRRDIKELEDAKFVVLDKTTEELWVKSFIKHNNVLAQPNVEKAMKASYETVRSTLIKQAVYCSVPEDHRSGMSDPFGNGKPPAKAEPLPEGFGEGSPHPNGKGVDPTQGYGSRESVVSGFEPAPEPETSPQPEPPTEPEPVTPTAPDPAEHVPAAMTEGEREIAAQKAFDRKLFTLTDRAMDVFAFTPKQHMATRNVMRMALMYLSDTLIDECIGYCTQLEEPPHAPQYLRKTLVQWAGQRSIEIPDISRVAS